MVSNLLAGSAPFSVTDFPGNRLMPGSAVVAELADAQDLGSCGLPVWVRVPPAALAMRSISLYVITVFFFWR